jgi:uncharacterized membrane protein
MYDPFAIVYRAPRESLYLFLEQMFSYGRGRASHFKLNSLLEYFFLIPLAFALYILSLPFLHHSLGLYLPILLYFTISILIAFLQTNAKVRIYQKLLIPFFFLLGHFSYGFGLMVGIVKYKIVKKLNIETRSMIKIHELKLFKQV